MVAPKYPHPLSPAQLAQVRANMTQLARLNAQPTKAPAKPTPKE